MSTITATASFSSWDEEPAFGPDAPLPRLSQASVAFRYVGAFEGTGECRYVLSYSADGNGIGAGFERITGSVAGIEGEVVLRHEVTFEADGVTDRYEILTGSGTGAFAATSALGGWNPFSSALSHLGCRWR